MTAQKLKAAGGALYKTLATEREVAIYPVTEADIDNIGRWSLMATVAFALASALASLAAGIWTNMLFESQPTDMARVASVLVAPILVFVALVFGIVGGWATFERGQAWHKIKGETRVV